MVRTNSSIWSRASGGGFTITSMPSPSTLRSKSVTRAATSMSASALRSSPVISQSIHTKRSFISRTLLSALSEEVLTVKAMGRQQRHVGVLCRLLLGGVWLVAGALKLPDPAENVRAVRAYRLLPEAVVPVVGHALPIVEILVGGCLLLGLIPRVAAVMSAVLLTAFVVAIASVWARGLSIECGCFGGGAGPAANASAAYPWEIARDLGLLLLSGWLVWRPRTPWSMDNRLVLA